MKFEDRKESTLTCPNCADGPRLIIRTNRATGDQFLGCPRWPGCDYGQDIPEDWLMTEAGARRLPGFE